MPDEPCPHLCCKEEAGEHRGHLYDPQYCPSCVTLRSGIPLVIPRMRTSGSAMIDYLDHGQDTPGAGGVPLPPAGQRTDPAPIPMAATAERLTLAVELDELERPQFGVPLPHFTRYADTVEHIASEALGHCQRLERELDDLRRAHAEEPVTRMDAVELEVRRLRKDLTELRRATTPVVLKAGTPAPAEHDLSVPAPWEQMDTRS